MTYTAPLNSPSFYGSSLSGLARSTQEIALSTARLSTGNRLINAGDDVAALTISSRLQSQVVGVKAAQQNATQGNSFLQVAYGGLLQIRDLLDEMSSLATQANSGSLTATERQLLQEEFAVLKSEVDRIAENTQFGDVNLLDGTVSGSNLASTTTTQATKASGSITFTANPTAGQTVVLNGVTLTEGVDFAAGGTTDATVTNLATALNASTNRAISQATYLAGGTTLTITQDSGGKLGNQYIIDQASSTTTFTTSGAATQVANVYTLTGGLDNGLRTNGLLATGTIGDALVNTQSQTSASVTLTVSGTISNGELLRIDNGNGGYVDFTFATTASASTDIQIGATTAETLQNTIKTVTQYTGTNNYGSRQLEFQRNGDQLIIRNKNVGNPTDLSGANLDIAETMANGALSAAAFSSGTTTGINVSGVNNKDFISTVGGFTATYVAADSITASVTIGSHTYTTSITDTTPAAASVVRFSSTSGGYFDVQLAAGGLAVTNQTDANTYATRLSSAISTLTFYQSRPVSNFSGTGGLAAASAEFRLKSFSSTQIEDITVAAPSGSSTDGIIELTLSGEIFRSGSGIGSSLGAYETLTLTSLTDANKTIRVTNGATVNSFSNSTTAATFQASLRDSFGLNATGVGLDFQVGTDVTDKINVNIGDARTTKLFGGVTPDISTQAGAAAASTTVTTALNTVNTIVANVGALQTRFDAAFDNLENMRINVDIARGGLADTDIASESTALASSILKANAATAVIAQVSQLQSSLLEMIRVAA